MYKNFLILLLNLSVGSLAPIETKLELVQILFRHGDRSPVMTYPTDPYNETTWARYGGFGQLTQTGMQQHNEWGKFLRDKYSDFFDIYYNKNKVSARSTDFDRTLMSAYSLLSGLYPPIDFQEWNHNIKWQPIAVHTTNAKDDMLFYSRYCARLDKLKRQVFNTSEFKQLNAEYKTIFDQVVQNSGFSRMDLNELWKIGDTLFVEKTHGLELPSWVDEIYDTIMEALKLGWYFNYKLVEMAKLTSGAILNDMKKNILNKINNKTPNELYLLGM